MCSCNAFSTSARKIGLSRESKYVSTETNFSKHDSFTKGKSTMETPIEIVQSLLV